MSELEFFATRYHVSLPDDFYEYFATVDGMDEGVMDEDMFWFMPLGKVKSVPEWLSEMKGEYSELLKSLANAALCFVFIDYLISSRVYAIQLSMNADNQTPIIWIDGPRYSVIASSLSEFLERFLADPCQVLFPDMG